MKQRGTALSLKELRALANRSGFTIEKTLSGRFRIIEDGTARRVPNRDGEEWHDSLAEIYESLTERA